MKMTKDLFVRVLSLLSVFILLFNMAPVVSNAEAHDPNDENYDYDLRFWEDKQPDIGFYINAAARYTLETVKEPSFGTTSGEWSVMNLLRGMYTGYDYLNDLEEEEDYFENYLKRIEAEVELKKGNLNRNKSTEWSRLILALSSLDYDITNVAGYDFIDKLSESHRFSYRQGINGPIWEIIALNTGGYEFYPDEDNPDVNTYGKMIDYILDKEIEQSDGTRGGWALANFGGAEPDPDITGMALQALAPYYKNIEMYQQTDATASYEEFTKSVERAIAVLADLQADNGAFKAFNNVNAESTVQVIVALTELGIDPLSKNVKLDAIDKEISFIKEQPAMQDGVETDNMIDALLTFWADGSGSEPGVAGFKHVTTGFDGGQPGSGSGYGVNDMATDQSLYGLIAYDRFLKGEKTLYDMTDMMSKKGGTPYTEYQAEKLEVTFAGFAEDQTIEKSPYGIVEIPDGNSAAGKEFIEWNTERDGSGVSYQLGENLSMPEHDITLYAQGENIEYSIDYETNGGEFNTDNIEDTYTVDDEIKLPTADDIKKEDYTFAGWYEDKKFTGEKTTIIPTGSYGDKVLYAKWIDASPSEEVKNVEKMIDDLPSEEELTPADKEAVAEARKAYDELSSDEQEIVSNIDKLITLEKRLEELSDELSIKTNLKDGLVTKADKHTFDLWAKDENGEKIDPADIEVTNNEQTVSVNWNDDEKTSYTLNLEVGENNIKIVVKDDYVLKYTIVREHAEDGDVIGTYTFSLEGFTIGLGHIIEPVQLDIIKGEDASEALLHALDEYGFEYSHWPAPSFYLEHIMDGENEIFKTDPKIPDVLKEALDGNYDENQYLPDSLGEFDFTSGSGWMYSVNGVFPNVGFADYYLTDGDVMRTQFTLALGSDLGGGMSDDLFEIANKDELTKKIAEINSSDQKEEYLSVKPQKQAYEQAMDTLQKVNATQVETDEALANIIKVEEKEKTDKQAAKEVDEQIIALPDVDELKLDDKETITSVREKYDELTTDQQNLVENLNLLEALEKQIEELESIAEDERAIKEVIDDINELPEKGKLTLSDSKAVESAREAFNSLSDEQQERVTNYDKLIELENTLEDLQDEEENQATADEVQELISSLPDVDSLTLDDGKAVEAALESFNNLSDEQQKQVTNYDKLIELEKALKELKVIEEDQAAAEKVQKLIDSLPTADSLTLKDKKLVLEAQTAFEALTEDQKEHLSNTDKLTNLIEKLEELEDGDESIDTSKLESVLEEAKNTDLENMTEESIKTLNDAIKAAEEILANPNVDQERVDQAVSMIEQALTNLNEKGSKKNPTPKGGNGEKVNNNKSPSDKIDNGKPQPNNSVNQGGSHKLPKTATNTFNFIMLGVALLIIGFGLLFVRRKKSL